MIEVGAYKSEKLRYCWKQWVKSLLESSFERMAPIFHLNIMKKYRDPSMEFWNFSMC